MTVREPFEIGESYHCYSRGVDKRIVFETTSDYERFIQSLYLCNNSEPVRRFEMEGVSHEEVLTVPRKNTIVSIVAYALMPNHFHLLLKETTDAGITTFMRKLGTAYTMYFNLKNNRTGNLFTKPFKSVRIARDAHYMHIPHYIHLNPAELFEPRWKEGYVRDLGKLEARLRAYPFSSFPEYCGITRPESVLLDSDAFAEWYEQPLSPSQVISEAAEYYAYVK